MGQWFVLRREAEIRDFCDTVDPFHLEEIEAVFQALRSKLEAIRNSMVDMLVDNVAF